MSVSGKYTGLFSILNLIPYSDDYGSCNTLLKIAVRCNHTSLITLCKMQKDFEKLLENTSQSVKGILMQSDIATKITSMIKQVKWPADTEFIAFSTPSCAIDKNYVEEKILERYVTSNS